MAHNTPHNNPSHTPSTSRHGPPNPDAIHQITQADLLAAATPPRMTETDALKEFNEWRMSRGLPPVIPRGGDIARRGRSLYLSDDAHDGLQALALMYTGRKNPSAFCEMLGLGILHIEEQPMRTQSTTNTPQDTNQ